MPTHLPETEFGSFREMQNAQSCVLASCLNQSSQRTSASGTGGSGAPCASHCAQSCRSVAAESVQGPNSDVSFLYIVGRSRATSDQRCRPALIQSSENARSAP